MTASATGPLPRFLLLITCGAAGALGCFPNDDRGPSCAPQFKIGQRLPVRLDVPYDAASDFRFDGSFLLKDKFRPPVSCRASDGLAPDAALTFIPREQLFAEAGECGAWRAEVEPEFVPDPHVMLTTIPSIPKVTIAAAFAEGSVGSLRIFATRVLYSPSGNPDGPLLPRQLPPLAVVRMIVTDSDWDNACLDSWVARWDRAL